MVLVKPFLLVRTDTWEYDPERTPDLPRDERLQMLDAIYKQAKVLEKVCLDPKIMDTSELELEPRPLLQDRVAPDAPA
jgi:hypothetical protein